MLELGIISWLKIFELVLGIAVFALHCIDEAIRSKYSFINTQGFCSPMVVQLMRVDAPFYTNTPMDRTIDILILLYAFVMYLMASVMTFIDVAGGYDDHGTKFPIFKSILAIVVAILCMVELILTLKRMNQEKEK